MNKILKYLTIMLYFVIKLHFERDVTIITFYLFRYIKFVKVKIFYLTKT